MIGLDNFGYENILKIININECRGGQQDSEYNVQGIR